MKSMRSVCVFALIPVAGFVALSLGCGEEKKQIASASASARPLCKDSPESEYEPRCHAGERDCCALYVRGKDENDPKNVEAFGLACAGGHVPACTIARQADRPPAWKLDVLGKACAVGMSDAACRASTFLGFVIEPDKMADRFAAYCVKKNASFQIGAGIELRCPTPDAAALAALKPDAIACADGAFERCKALAGVDGNSANLLRPIAADAWKKRGFDANGVDEVLDGRVLAATPAEGRAMGSVVVAVADSALAGAKALDKKAVGDAIRRDEARLKGCIGLTSPGANDKGGKVAFDVIVDARGVIAATSAVVADLNGSLGLDACARGAVQDSKLEGVNAPGRARVTLTLGK